MSTSSIKQNAQGVAEAYESYSKLVLDPSHDRKKAERLKKYILSLSNDTAKKLKELEKNVYY
ncbi:MAG: hypothetical protein Q8Q42_02805 [Nanoarchaeota archaeon]|nr:hypothetical protein [Nanoarchaeota archaeon]